MSALAVLYLVLPFPLAFIIHDVEEIAVQHRWMLAHREALALRFPKMKPMIEQLAQLNTKAFAIAAFEELVVLLLTTAYALLQEPYCMEVWAALFMAFSIHLLVHVGQAILVRGYVPGVATSLLLLPFAGYGMWSIWLAMSGWEMLTWGVVGIIIMVLNLRFAHWLGKKISKI
ncbi:MAG: HXXEE domain-containing protein [Bacteroidales bacterium]|nr:HXXEE domain-containing protein [Bacteroidales bacterium]